MKHQEELKNNRRKLYARSMQYLSPKFVDEIKRMEDDEMMKFNHDPLMLWNEIEETHKVPNLSKVAAVLKHNTRKEYTRLKQGSFESIIVYQECFDVVLKAYQD